MVVATGAEQQLMVRAKYSDGRVRDVTRWVKFSSSDEGVASVDDLGHVKMNGNGEAAITLWYSSRVLYARVSVPYPNQVEAAIYEKFQRHNYVDDLVLDKWKTLNIAPSPAADPAEVESTCRPAPSTGPAPCRSDSRRCWPLAAPSPAAG